MLEAINHQEENVNFIRDNSSITEVFLFQSSKHNIFGHICVKKVEAKLITGFEMHIQEIHSCHIEEGTGMTFIFFSLSKEVSICSQYLTEGKTVLILKIALTVAIYF